MVFLISLVVLAYFYGIFSMPLRGEEANRILVALEMLSSGDFFNPTHLGESYFNKPPLFNWLIALSYSSLGNINWINFGKASSIEWGIFSARLVSILSVFLTAFLLFFFLKNVKNSLIKNLAFIGTFIFLTLGDLLFFYGFLAEIDAFLMFLFWCWFVLTFFLLQRSKILTAFLWSGLMTALYFLTKGFPAFYHIPITFLFLLWFFKKEKNLFSLRNFSAYLIPLVGILAFWFWNLKFPFKYLHTLWNESFNRLPSQENTLFFKHLLTYPLLNFKQTLPHSLFFLGKLKDAIKKISFRIHIQTSEGNSISLAFLSLVFFINYLPYWISPKGEGRYILILFPIIAIIFALVLKNFYWHTILKNWIYKLAFIFLLIVSLLDIALWCWHLNFFVEFSPIWYFYVPIIPLSLLYFRRHKTLISFLVISLFLLKIGYINYIAPWKEQKHPFRTLSIFNPHKAEKYCSSHHLDACVYLKFNNFVNINIKEAKSKKLINSHN